MNMRSGIADEPAPADESGTPPALNRRALALTLLAAFSQDAVYGLIFLSYMNHYLLDVLKASPGLPGYTLALYGACKLGIHPIAGRLIDRISPRFVFRVCFGIEVLGALVLIFVQSLTGFLVAAALLAIGSAGIWPLVYDVVARTQTPASHSHVTGLLSLSGYIATGTGFAAGILAGRFAPHYGAFLMALGLVAAPLILQASPALDRTVHVRTSHPVKSGASLRSRLAGIALFGSIIFIDYSAISSLAGVYGPYVRLTLHITLVQTVVMLAPAGAAALVALFVASRLSRPGRRMLEMCVCLTVSAVGAFGLAATSTPWVAAVFAIPLAIGTGAISPIIAASMIEQGGQNDRGLVLGTLMSIEGIGAVVGPALTAVVIDLFNPQAGVATIGITFTLLIPLTLFAAKRGSVTRAAEA
ncbi:MAG: MFS transporter [Tepidiformaceae bacterium]